MSLLQLNAIKVQYVLGRGLLPSSKAILSVIALFYFFFWKKFILIIKLKAINETVVGVMINIDQQLDRTYNHSRQVSGHASEILFEIGQSMDITDYVRDYTQIHLTEVEDPTLLSWVQHPSNGLGFWRKKKKRPDEHRHYHSLLPMAETMRPETVLSSHLHSQTSWTASSKCEPK